ncbi:MAG: response regulator [Actinobacteria bacterium]|nr:response regulator [Actinomycetota bacterium]
MAIRIMLADDHRLFRAGLRALIEKQTDIEVVAEADNGRLAVELAKRLRPEVVVMDISMPDLNGIEATRQIISGLDGTKVLSLSMHSDSRFVEGMLKAGASGYLLKDCAHEEFIRAIRAVAAGQTYLSPAVTDKIVKDYVQQAGTETDSIHKILTPREREVLQLVAEGLGSKQIAAQLGVSVKTVETHRHQIMERLNMHSVAELTKFAVREGLTSLEG